MSCSRAACAMVGTLWLALGAHVLADDAAHGQEDRPARHEPVSKVDEEWLDEALEADGEFLEFLGTIDTEHTREGWLDYLARWDLSKLTKSRKRRTEAAEVKQ